MGVKLRRSDIALPGCPMRASADYSFSLNPVFVSLDDTVSNLNAGDPQAPNFPQYGHGNIALPALFNDPSDLE